ncbi:acyltransferase [Cyanobacteria bacterium FACHB-63]|nr:acyltransferase [Cyanobacteria bacterium FACHB-63]
MSNLSVRSSSQNFHNSNKESQHEKFEGFDFLRTVFAIAIVAIHANLFLLVKDLKIGSLSLEPILSANVAYLAVPVFFQISLFLFYRKSLKAGFNYFLQKSLPKIVSLYLFWVISKIIFDILLKGKSEPLQHGLSSPRAFIELTISGGSSPLYFFFSLAFITTLTEFFLILLRRIKKNSVKSMLLYSLLIASFILVTFFSILRLPNTFIEVSSGLLKFKSGLAQWDYNPLNFLPYIFTSAIAAEEFNAGKLREFTTRLKIKLSILFTLFLCFTVLEWFLFTDKLQYSRLSLIFGSWLLLYLAVLAAHEVPKIVRFISGCSLGIYTFHIFLTDGWLTNILLASLGSFLSPNWIVLLEFLLALAGSVGLTLLFRQNKFLKGFV